MAQRIFKNLTDNIIYINDLGEKQIPPHDQVDFAESYTLEMLANSKNLATALVKDIAETGYSTYLILNDGANDLKAIDSVDLLRNITQKSNLTTDGYLENVNRSPSIVSTNQLIDKNYTYYLAPLNSIVKKLTIAPDKRWNVCNFGGSSEPSNVRAVLYYEIDGEMINPFVDACNESDLIVLQTVSPTDTIIYVNNFNNELDFVLKNKLYLFENSFGEDVDLRRRIVDINKGNNTITIDSPLGIVFNIGGFLSLCEKPLRSIMLGSSIDSVEFIAPLRFFGNIENSHIVISLTNLNKTDDASVSCFLNGWEESIEGN